MTDLKFKCLESSSLGHISHEYKKKSRCVSETLQYAPSGNKVQKAIFSFKVKVKVTRSLTLVSLERASLGSMHAKYEVSISYGSKVKAKVKVDNRQTDRQTNRETGQKQYAPDHSIWGHKKINLHLEYLPWCIPHPLAWWHWQSWSEPRQLTSDCHQICHLMSRLQDHPPYHHWYHQKLYLGSGLHLPIS